MAIGTAIAASGAIAGGIGGAIEGFSDAPDTITDQTSQLELADKSPQQQLLEQEGLDQFAQAKKLIEQQELGLAGAGQLQGQARGTIADLLAGRGFELTPEEQQRSLALEGAQIARGQTGIQRFLEENLGQLNRSAGQRGLRGQAAQQLNSGALDTGARQLTDLTLGAQEGTAARNLAIPGQRVGVQAQLAQGNASIADLLGQQAIQNRLAVQNPALLQSLQQERLATGQQTGQRIDRGQEGSTLAGIGGLLGGIGAGAGAGSNVAGGLANIDLTNTVNDRLKKKA